MNIKDSYLHGGSHVVKNIQFGIASSGTNNGKLVATITWAQEGVDNTELVIPISGATFGTQTKNTVYAAPSSANGAPSFRALVAADIPEIGAGLITSGTLGADRLPLATNTTKGTVILGAAADNTTNITGKQYWVKMNANGKIYVDVPWVWTQYVGASANANGTAGYIPAATAGNQGKFFRADGTWQDISQNVSSALYVGGSGDLSANAQIDTNGNVYLTLKEGSTYYKHKISGTGRASVTSDASGNIIINSSGYSAFTAATSSAAGGAGLVPAPGANVLGSGNYFLRADATWQQLGSRAFDSTAYVPIAGGTMTGTLTMQTNGTGSYNQGIRINRINTSSWALLLIGKSGDATSGTGTSTAGDGAWLIGTPASSNSLIFNLNDASETKGLCLKGHGNNDIKWNNNTIYHEGNIPSNTKDAAGIVAKGVASRVYMTDASGNPSWTQYDTTVTESSGKLITSGAVYTAIANSVAGAVQYLGTVASEAAMIALTGAGQGDFARVTTSFTFTDATGASVTAHVGDVVYLTNNTPGTSSNWIVAHTEIDTNTWTAASTSAAGYIPKLATGGAVLDASSTDYVLAYVNGATTPAWRKLPTNAYLNTWTAWKGATSSANGTAGYMPAPTSAQRGQFLRGDGSWVDLNNYSLPTATSSALGGVKVGDTLTDATGYTAVKIKDGVIYYHDTTYSFSNLSFQNSSGTALMTYNSQAARTVKQGSCISFSHANNVLTISSTDELVKFSAITANTNYYLPVRAYNTTDTAQQLYRTGIVVKDSTITASLSGNASTASNLSKGNSDRGYLYQSANSTTSQTGVGSVNAATKIGIPYIGHNGSANTYGLYEDLFYLSGTTKYIHGDIHSTKFAGVKSQNSTTDDWDGSTTSGTSTGGGTTYSAGDGITISGTTISTSNKEWYGTEAQFNALTSLNSNTTYYIIAN